MAATSGAEQPEAATSQAEPPEPGEPEASKASEVAALDLVAWADRFHHDLRTPLAVIDGMAETLATAGERLGEDDRTRLLASIRRQAARATRLLDEGIELVRAEGLDRR